MAAKSEALVEAVLWVAERLDDPEWRGQEIPAGLRRTMWNFARDDRAKFFDRYLAQALAWREKDAAVGESAVREMEEKEIARLQKKLKGMMAGRQRVFCEKCWTELGGELGPVELIQAKGVPA